MKWLIQKKDNKIVNKFKQVSDVQLPNVLKVLSGERSHTHGYTFEWTEEEPYGLKIFNNCYEIYPNGDIYSIKGNKNILLETVECNDGHMRVSICVNGKNKMFQVHQLLAQFYKPKEWFPFCHVHHINLISSDNRLENLQCLTPKQHHQLHSEAHSNPVMCVETGEVYRSCKQASIAMGSPSGAWSIKNIACGDWDGHKTAYGYHWKFVDRTLAKWEYKVELNPVRCIETGATFPHLQAFALYVNRNNNEHIPTVCLTTMEYKGFHFEYISENELGSYHFTYHRKPNPKKKHINYYWI